MSFWTRLRERRRAKRESAFFFSFSCRLSHLLPPRKKKQARRRNARAAQADRRELGNACAARVVAPLIDRREREGGKDREEQENGRVSLFFVVRFFVSLLFPPSFNQSASSHPFSFLVKQAERLSDLQSRPETSVREIGQGKESSFPPLSDGKREKKSFFPSLLCTLPLPPPLLSFSFLSLPHLKA